MTSKQWIKKVHAKANAMLIEHGFRKQGSSYICSANQCILIINIQRSDDSTVSLLKLTCNLGVFLTGLPSSAEAPADIWSCHWRRRLGFLMPQRQDVWWTIASDAESDAVAQNIAESIAFFGLQELLSKGSVDAMIDYWKSGESAGLTDSERLQYLSELERCREKR